MEISLAEQAKTELKRTPLYEAHREKEARMVEFAGWLMPVQYQSILEEHRTVRERCGLFDISHMGEIEVREGGADNFLQKMVTGDIASLEIGRAQYNLLLNEQGGTIDDLIVYRRGEHRYFLVVNAANTDKDFRWLLSHTSPDVEVLDHSLKTGLLALQGPLAQEILQPLVDFDLARLGYYWASEGKVAGHPAFIGRTGYTGEDGFELFADWNLTPSLWQILLAAGKDYGILPCGLGARDTLRLEAGFHLYGHELNENTTPLEAGLSRFVSLEKGEFMGRSTLVEQKEKGVRKRLIGLKMEDPGIPRQGYPILRDGREVGLVTSGSHSPTLGYPIALGFVATEVAEIGKPFAIMIHGEPRRAISVPRPFYRRPR